MEGMSKTVVVIGSMAAALAAVGVLGLVEVLPAEATFPGKNGKIAFQSDRGGSYEIYTMNRNGNKIDKLTTNTTEDEDPAFSPNGKRIVFRSNRDGNSDIYKMNADRTKRARVVRLTTNPADDEDPAFSPDGKKIDTHPSGPRVRSGVGEDLLPTCDQQVESDALVASTGARV